LVCIVCEQTLLKGLVIEFDEVEQLLVKAVKEKQARTPQHPNTVHVHTHVYARGAGTDPAL
jgi:hypothetical protein